VLTEAAVERVVLRIATGNKASIRVAEKAGFTYEGTARNAGIAHSSQARIGGPRTRNRPRSLLTTHA
jgi:RimJ/RimL family protein N-acetyltransferase